ncbi:MAG: phospholipase D-like domain-containing protein [Planctomycetota bacterium]|nr:phospholipase D-like domain-containing protein [Planctomycetota bacterium]
MSRVTPTHAIESAIERVFAPHLAPPRRVRFWRGLASRWRRTLRILWPLGGVSQGNRVRVFEDGDDLFEAMWEAILRARERIVMTTYILSPDRVGLRTLSALEAAARRDVEVDLRYDAVGSSGLGEEWIDGLRKAGARVRAFNPIRLGLHWPIRLRLRWPILRLRWPISRLRWRFSPLLRDHRKILVVDERVAYCGGMNVAEEYAGEKWGTGVFRDTHLELEGPCVVDLGGLLAEGSTKPAPEAPSTDLGEATFVQVLESDRRRNRRAIQRALRVTLARAAERCWLTSPYFLPPRRLRRAITKAAARGLDVRVLTAGRSDVPLVHMASQHVYGRFLRAGVRIFEMSGRILHAKTVAIDGVYCSVGSFNLDRISYRRNLEVNVTALDRELTAELERQFLHDLTLSEEVTLATWEDRTWLQRSIHWAAYHLARLI